MSDTEPTTDDEALHHDWQRLDSGEIDDFAYDGDTHNGPRCVLCDEGYCHHCEPDCYRYICEAKADPEAWERERLVGRIQSIRTRNNQHWMDLMRLALEAEPEKAKAILRNIEQADEEVRQAMRELANS